jgi:hypothetical protein
MMKEFGVKFYIEGKCIISKCIVSSDLSTIDFDKTIQIDFEEEYLDQILGSFAQIKNLESKIYVAAESEHIFEPKYWDLGRCFKRNIIANFIDGKWENGTVKFDLKTTKIIMRNNIQFFMPEVENER